MQDPQKDSEASEATTIINVVDLVQQVTEAQIAPLVHHFNECAPISNLSHVWTYLQNPPEWIVDIPDLVPRSPGVIKNTSSDCHVESDQFRPSTRLDRHLVPRTLVCHDMKGGYLEDKFVGPVNLGNGYTFYRWSQIDIFVYFSHHLITIPPLHWITAAHNNGVQILGTFITEWKPGEEVCRQIFQNRETLQLFVDIMVELCVLFKLDGWLLNIENQLEDAAVLKDFVKDLTDKLHARKPGSLIIWYDSVIHDGRLKWQNELNDLNRCFFDLCDGIFINYTWKEENLVNTIKAAQHRRFDVYVGVDVFGRNCYGGGLFNTYLAAEKIREHNLSMAIFAPGWTHETLEAEPAETFFDRFIARDNIFWRSLWRFLYTHPVAEPFLTFFYLGVDKEWFKLYGQETQLSHFLHAGDGRLPVEAADVPTLQGTCSCLRLHQEDCFTLCHITTRDLTEGPSYTHRLLYTDIPVADTLIFYCFTKNVDPLADGTLRMLLLLQHRNGSLRKVVCHGLAQDATCLQDNSSVVELNPSRDPDVIHLVARMSDVPEDWVLKCYVLDVVGSRILEIGAVVEGACSACLCGIGFKKLVDVEA